MIGEYLSSHGVNKDDIPFVSEHYTEALSDKSTPHCSRSEGVQEMQTFYSCPLPRKKVRAGISLLLSMIFTV